MPKMKKFYCPICDEGFFDRLEARECLRTCKSNLEVREADVYSCGRCGAEFIAQEFLLEHELRCTVPDQHLNDGCNGCERRTREGYIDAECKRLYPVVPRVNCPGYQPAMA